MIAPIFLLILLIIWLVKILSGRKFSIRTKSEERELEHSLDDMNSVIDRLEDRIEVLETLLTDEEKTQNGNSKR
jgi:hypothetical protein